MDIQIRINNKNINLNKNSETLFEIREYTKAEFSFCDNKDNSYILLDTFNKENKKILKNERIILNEQLNLLEKGEISLISDTYPFIYYDGEKEYNYSFYVKPSIITDKDLEIIKYTLENYRKGLSVNTLSLKNGSCSEKIINLELLNFITILINEKNKIKYILEKIKKEPITNLKKEYKKENYLKNCDSKILNYICKKNINIQNEQRNRVFISKKILIDTECNENIWLIQTLKKILLILNKSFDILNLEQKSCDKFIKRNEEEQKKCNEIILKHKKSYNFSRQSLLLNEIRLKTLEQNLRETKEIIKKTENYIIEIKELTKILNEFINNFKFSINKKNSLVNFKILKNVNYNYINSLIKKNSTKNYLKKNKLYFQNKQTYELYEYYSFVMLIKILNELDFYISIEKTSSLFQSEIRANQDYIFNSNDYEIKVSYDKEINNLHNDIGFICSNTHNKPDFLISLYNNGNLIKSLIIEVKCSKTKNIYNKNYTTKVIEQIRSYNFYHYKEKNRYIKDIISKVIVLYPKQDEIIPIDDSVFKFIPIKPLENMEDMEAYNILKRELEIFIKNNQKIY